jgi:hypothetical protein
MRMHSHAHVPNSRSMNTVRPTSKPMTEQQRAKWENLRSRPIRLFLRFGVLIPTLVFAVIRLIPDYVGLFGAHWRGWTDEFLDFAFGALFFGIFFTWWCWRSTEAQYKSTLLVGSSPPEWK